MVTSDGLGVGERLYLRIAPRSHHSSLLQLFSLSLSGSYSVFICRDHSALVHLTDLAITSMALPPFSAEQLSTLVTSNIPSSELFEILSQYEMDACLMCDGSDEPGTTSEDTQLLSQFYSIFFFVHLLTNQMSVLFPNLLLRINLLTNS